MRRKIAIGIVSVLTVLTLAGCGCSNSSDTGSDAGSNTAITPGTGSDPGTATPPPTSIGSLDPVDGHIEAFQDAQE